MNTQRAHRRIDWISDSYYEAGIIRFGRMSFPGSWLLTPYIIISIAALVTGCTLGISHGLWLWFIPFAVLMVVPLAIWAWYGLVPALHKARKNRQEHLARARRRYEDNVKRGY